MASSVFGECTQDMFGSCTGGEAHQSYHLTDWVQNIICLVNAMVKRIIGNRSQLGKVMKTGTHSNSWVKSSDLCGTIWSWWRQPPSIVQSLLSPLSLWVLLSPVQILSRGQLFSSSNLNAPTLPSGVFRHQPLMFPGWLWKGPTWVILWRSRRSTGIVGCNSWRWDLASMRAKRGLWSFAGEQMTLEIYSTGEYKFRDGGECFHRLSGPAILYKWGRNEWRCSYWINGVQYTEKEYWKRVKTLWVPVRIDSKGLKYEIWTGDITNLFMWIIFISFWERLHYASFSASIFPSRSSKGE